MKQTDCYIQALQYRLFTSLTRATCVLILLFISCSNLISDLSTTDGTVKDYDPPLKEFDKRDTITVTNNTGMELTEYTVSYTTPYYKTMKANFSDIRFTDSDNTVLPHWLETATTSTEATFWIKLATIPENKSILYMYYGHTYAISTSNIHTIFVFGDDFTEDRIKENWNILPATPPLPDTCEKDYSIGNGSLHVTHYTEDYDPDDEISDTVALFQQSCGYIFYTPSFNSFADMEIVVSAKATSIDNYRGHGHIMGVYIFDASQYYIIADKWGYSLYTQFTDSMNTSQPDQVIVECAGPPPCSYPYFDTEEYVEMKGKWIFNINSTDTLTMKIESIVNRNQYITGFATTQKNFSVALASGSTASVYNQETDNGIGNSVDWKYIYIRKKTAIEPVLSLSSTDYNPLQYAR